MHLSKYLAVALSLVAPLVAQAQTPNIITTIAGGGPNKLPALSSSIYEPERTVVDSAGNMFISDLATGRIYKVDATGQLTVYAGTGANAYGGDGGLATGTSLSDPIGLALDSSGNLYVAEAGSCLVREIVASTGLIKTVAGNFQAGCGYSGDGGPATSATLDPLALYVDSAGNIFITDFQNFVVREVIASTGTIITVAGNGTQGRAGDGGPATSAQLNGVMGVYADTSGNIFIADRDNHVIREVVAATGKISTIAGNGGKGYTGDGGPAISAQLGNPEGVFLDAAGNIFIIDIAHFVVREIVAATGKIKTVAGTGVSGNTGEGGPATNAKLGDLGGIFLDASGDIFITDFGNSVVREVVAATGNIKTVAGNAHFGYSGDGFPAKNASLWGPSSVFADRFGNIYIADTGNYAVRKVAAATGIIQTVAGNGTPGYTGDNGPATSAQITPASVFVDSSGNIFLADADDNVVREVVASTGKIQTVAGNGTPDYTGDNGLATSATLNSPTAVYVDKSGNIFIADYANNVIREVIAATGNIQTVAGNHVAGYTGDDGPATSAELNNPQDVFLDSSGNIFIADTANCVIREVIVATGNIQTVAGNGTPGRNGNGGPATSARLDYPTGVLVDSSSNIFIADGNNNVVREVVASTGNIQIAAGDGTVGYSGDGGPALGADLGLVGIAQGPSGSLLIASNNANVIRSVAGLVSAPSASLSAASVAFPDQIVGTLSSVQIVTVTNSGTAVMSIGSVKLSGANSEDFIETDTCANRTIRIGGACTLILNYMPSLAGPESALLTIANDGNGPQTLAITGGGITVALATAPGASTTQTVKAGQTASYTLQLSAAGGTAPTDRITTSITCTGAPALSTCNVPATVVLTPATPGTFQVTVATSGLASLATGVHSWPQVQPPLLFPALQVTLFALLLFVAFLPLGKMSPVGFPSPMNLMRRMGPTNRAMRTLRLRAVRMTLLAGLALLPLSGAVVLTGCGGSSAKTTPTPTPIPTQTTPGTYTLTVTATIGNQTKATQLTLIVQ